MISEAVHYCWCGLSFIGPYAPTHVHFPDSVPDISITQDTRYPA